MRGLYDEIAAFYDPWSRSVTEDIGFYVDEALASGGPVVELAVGTGRIAVPIAQTGVAVIGVDSSPGMLAVARAAADDAGARRPSTCESATSATRRSTSASRSSSARSARSCTWRPRTRSSARYARLARCSRRVAVRLRRLRPEPRGHRRDERPLARARARDLGARGLGRGVADAHALRPLGRLHDVVRPALALRRRSGSASSTRPGSTVDAVYGWFDRRPHDGEEDMIFVARPID